MAGLTLPSTGRTIKRLLTTFNTRVGIAGTAIPHDDTIPQSTEGDEVVAVTYTPDNPNSRIEVSIEMTCGQDGSSGSGLSMALFKDAGTDAIATASGCVNAAGTHIFNFQLAYEELAGSTAARTFKVRVGGNGGAVGTSVNGASGVRKHGGAQVARLLIEEKN